MRNGDLWSPLKDSLCLRKTKNNNTGPVSVWITNSLWITILDHKKMDHNFLVFFCNPHGMKL